jgi:hypothetical protein
MKLKIANYNLIITGKLVERQGRKTNDLKSKDHDSQVAKLLTYGPLLLS